jgi:hypothetical protein
VASKETARDKVGKNSSTTKSVYMFQVLLVSKLTQIEGKHLYDIAAMLH